MKTHKTALEVVSAKLGFEAKARLPVMYDRALAALAGTTVKSIRGEPEFETFTELLPAQKAGGLRWCRVIDKKTGHYVKLTELGSPENLRLEIGALYSFEYEAGGQLNIRSW